MAAQKCAYVCHGIWLNLSIKSLFGGMNAPTTSEMPL